MAWTVTTYAGTRATGQPSKYRTCMFELIRGIRERETAKGATTGYFAKTFYKATGSPVSGSITMADLELLSMSRAFYNLKAIRDSVTNLVNTGLFYEDDTFTTAWTKASLETDIGTDLDADPIRMQEARFWQAMQDALDRLVYMKRAVAPTEISSDWKDWAGSSVTPQQVWDNTLSESPTAGLLDVVGYQCQYGPANSGNADILDNLSATIDSSALVGTATAAFYQIRWASTNRNYFTGVLGVNINTTYIEEDASMPTANYDVEYAADLADLDFGTAATLTQTIDTVPTTIPFSMTLGEFRTSRFECDLSSVIFGLDLTTYLTDQA